MKYFCKEGCGNAMFSRSFPNLLTVEPLLDGDDGVAGGHGLHHPAGRDVAEEGEEEEEDGGGGPASHGEGCGKCEGPGPNYQIEDEHSRSSGGETSRGLLGHLGQGTPGDLSL